MTQNIIITASEIQQGDKIAVTITDTTRLEDRVVSCTYTGVAHENTDGMWRTEQRWNLYAHETGAVIELLDRPKKTVVPGNAGAVVQYEVNFDSRKPHRTAIRNSSGVWKAYCVDGIEQDTHYSDEDFSEWLTGDSFPFKVLFEGVAK